MSQKKENVEQKLLLRQMEEEKKVRKEEYRAGVAPDAELYYDDTVDTAEGEGPRGRKESVNYDQLMHVDKPLRPKRVPSELSLIEKNWSLDIRTLQRLEDEDVIPTEAEEDFIKEQLQSNKYLISYHEEWDKKINKILAKEPAIEKFGLKAPIMAKLTNHSPIRRAKADLDVLNIGMKRPKKSPAENFMLMDSTQNTSSPRKQIVDTFSQQHRDQL